jgi:hypothetical protein
MTIGPNCWSNTSTPSSTITRDGKHSSPMTSCGSSRLRPPAGLSRRTRFAMQPGSPGAVENFRFFDLRIYATADAEGAVAEVKGEGLIKATGRMYRQEFVVFLRANNGKIAFLREYFDPVHAAEALNVPILGCL